MQVAEVQGLSFHDYMNGSAARIPFSVADDDSVQAEGHEHTSRTTPHLSPLHPSLLLAKAFSDDDEEQLWSKV